MRLDAHGKRCWPKIVRAPVSLVVPRLGSTRNTVLRRNMEATPMADDSSQSLESLIRRQMGAQPPGHSGQGGLPVGSPYLWTAMGEELRRARTVLARTRTTAEMEAAAARLRERLLGQGAGSAVLPTGSAVPMVDSAEV